jgi:anti-sigma-K factor RskA
MTSHELSALVGAYAIDALDEPERELFEAHLADCTDCTAEVAGLRAAAAELSHTTASPPPAALRSELLAAIGRVRPLPPRAGPTSSDRRRPARRWHWPAVAAACALIAAIAVGWGVQEHRQLAGHRISPSALSSLFDSPDVATASVPIGSSGHATLIYSKSERRLLLIGQHLPVPPPDKTYQLWMLSPDGIATPAGLFRPDGNGTVLAQVSGDLSHTARMGISIERSGGAAQPTAGAVVAAVAI